MATLDSIVASMRADLTNLQTKLKSALDNKQMFKANVLTKQIAKINDIVNPPKYKYKITKRTKQEAFEKRIQQLNMQFVNPYDYNRKTKKLIDPLTGDEIVNGKRNIKKVNKNVNKYNKIIEKQINNEIKAKLETTKKGDKFDIPLSQKNNLREIAIIIDSFTRYITNDEHVIISLNVGGQYPIYYTFNTRNRDRLRNIIEKILTTGTIIAGTSGSDIEIINRTRNALSMGVQIVKVGRVKKNGKLKTKPAGGFFPYYHNTKFDFTRYQIFKNEKQADYYDNCLVHALKIGGLSEVKINHFRLLCRNRDIPLCKLEELCKITKIQINLKFDTEKSVKIYGESEEQYNIGVLENHFFINEDINISIFCINNYEDVKEIDDCNLIFRKVGKYYEKNKNYKINTFLLINELIKNGESLLTNITYSNGLLSTQYHNKNDLITSLEYPDSCCEKIITDNEKEIKQEEQRQAQIAKQIAKGITPVVKENKIWEKVFFDIETDPTGIAHIPFLVRTKKLVNGSFIEKCFIGYGDKCILDFLQSLTNNSLLIAHNAGGYDSVFLVKFLFGYGETCNGNNVLKCKGNFTNLYTNKTIEIIIKDSLKLINMRLDEFPGCFFPNEAKTFVKEVMPYNLYTKTNIEKVFCNIDDGIEILKLAGKNDKDIKQFQDNIDKWKLKKDNTFDIITYADIYCKRDVDILERGYEIFRGWMLELTKYDIDKITTLASLSDKFLISKNCYEGCYQLSGVPQMFIMKCVVGGRCMTRQNKRFKCKETMQALDAKSLYPSAMNRMGFLKGKPKVIKTNELNYKNLKKYDGFFVEVVATGITTKRDFPLLSYFDNNGSRLFTNDVIGRTFHLDKTMFEDAMEFQGITFEIKRGYYFNSGRNYNIKEVIRNMYNARVEKRKSTAEFPDGNPIQLAYKELLNCSYGKTILKPTEFEYDFIDGQDKFNDYLRVNYNFIQEFTNITDNKYRFKRIKTIDDHFNRPQIGVEILSMSKRVMNEVMCLAEDNKVIIAYQDTDSMSMLNSQLEIITKLFFNKYGRVLIGEDMGEFGNDLKFNYTDNNGNTGKAKKVVSVESQFLGKKCYHHKLQGEDKQGNKVYGDYIRMKGVSGASIEHICKTNNKNVNQIYEALVDDKGKYIKNNQIIDGCQINFDLLCKDENGIATKVSFIKNKNKTIGNRTEFTRGVNFTRVAFQEYEGFTDAI
jgi:hypothetical protein